LTNFVKIFLPVLFKQPAAFLLLLSFLAQSFSKYILVVDYCANTAAYAEKCVNKDKPWMHCNGRCQFCKKMEQQENPDKQAPEKRAGNDKNDPLSCEPCFTDLQALYRMAGAGIRYGEIASDKAVRMPRSFFHPPDRIC
jgi:hypothetical protein